MAHTVILRPTQKSTAAPGGSDPATREPQQRQLIRIFILLCLQGFTPGLFGVSHGAVQFMAYEELKVMIKKR